MIALSLDKVNRFFENYEDYTSIYRGFPFSDAIFDTIEKSLTDHERF